MDKAELKKLRLANLRKGKEAAKKRRAEGRSTEGHSAPSSVPAKENAPVDAAPPRVELPPPLEPLAGPVGALGSDQPPPLPSASFSGLQPKTVGKIGNNYFRAITNGVSFVLPRHLEIEITNLDEAEEELLGTFVIPILEKYLPRFKDSPEYALGVVAVGLYFGKIKVRRRERGLNVGDTAPREVVVPVEPPPAPIPEAAPDTGPRRDVNIGNAGSITN